MPTHPSPPTAPVVLGFFAHPDDETLTAGGALACIAARAQVHVITATRGEMGEIVAPEGHRTSPERTELTALRINEVKEACQHLGVASHEFLSGDYHDSGMVWADERRIQALPDPQAPVGAFSLAPIEEVAQVLAERIISLEPTLVLTEEPAGGYGHPDHVHCHDAMMRAIEIARPTWSVPFVAFVVQEETRVRQANIELASLSQVPAQDSFGMDLHKPDLHAPLRTGVSVNVDALIDTSSVTARVAAAIGAHHTQIHALQLHTGEHLAGWYALTNNDLKPLVQHAGFILAPGSGSGEDFIDFLTGLGCEVVGKEPTYGAVIYSAFLSAFALLSGIIVGFAGSFTHRANNGIGLAVALTVVFSGVVLNRSIGSFKTGLMYCAGVIGAVFAITVARRGTDVVIVEDWLGLTWLAGTFGGLLLGLVCAEKLMRPRRKSQ